MPRSASRHELTEEETRAALLARMSNIRRYGCAAKRPPTFDANRTWINRQEAEGGTLSWSQPRTSQSTLHFLRDQAHLLTYLPGNDLPLLRHFLVHYVDGLGLRPAHIHVAIGSAATQLEEHAALLRSWGITHVDVQAGAYSDRRRIEWFNARTGKIHDHALARAGARGEANVNVTTDSYVLVADHDEFVSFPRSVAEALFKYGRVCGQMADMLAFDGSIAPVAPWPHLSYQFPTACHLRQVWGFYGSKTVLFRSRFRMRNPHNLINISRCAYIHAGVAHYTLTSTALNFTEAKAARHLDEAKAWRSRAAAERAANSSLTVDESYQRTKSSDEYIQCSHGKSAGESGPYIQPPGEPCPDYIRLADFMRAQQADPGRDVSCICHAHAGIVARQVPAAPARLKPAHAELKHWGMQASPQFTDIGRSITS